MKREALEVRLLGELEVVHRGRVQPLPASKKTRALLAYLVATARPALRERLCALLWEGPDDPRAALRWSLTKIRPLLDVAEPGARLEADRERVAFVPGRTTVDAAAVRALLAGGAAAAPTEKLREAAARFRGEFLEGLDLPGCYRYHEWCVGEREALRALRTGVLAELVARLGDAPEEALRFARERVAIDPLTEAAHVDVVRMLAALGRKREALAQYETCRRILEAELGTRVSPALEQARRDLDARATGAAADGGDKPSAPSAPAAAPLARPPLVGRDAARAAIEAAVAGAAAGITEPASLLLFLGDPGIGKSRLLDLLADHVRAAGGTVLRGRAFEAEMVRPYGPWLDALRAAPASTADGRAAETTLWPEPGGAGGGDRGRLFEGVAAALARRAQQAGPLALLLDDVQWLDEASSALLHYVARAPLGGRVLLAAAARAGELGDNAAALRVIRALDRERRLSQHRLAPLGPAETATLVRAIHPSIDAAGAAQVFASSEGNPLYAQEIARAAAAGAGTPGESLDALLDERLGRLDEAARDLVPWAAALGRSFDPTVLALVTGARSAELLHALEQLERHGVVRPTGDTYDFVHDLIRQAAYRRLSEPRRRLVHLQIARVLQGARAGDAALAGEIAHHAAQGGDAELAAEASIAAGERCVRMFAYADAAELATRGLQQVTRVEGTARVRLQIALYAVLVESGSPGRRPTLEAELSSAVVEAQEAGLHADAARGFQALSQLHYTGDEVEGARESSRRAVDELRHTAPATRALRLAESARCFMMLEHDVPHARDLVGEARALLGPDAERVAELDWAAGLLARFVGDPPAAALALDAAIDGFARAEAHWERCSALFQRVMVDLEQGRPAAARALCAPMREVAGKITGGSEPAVAAALEALTASALGDPGAAEALERAVAELRAVDAKAMLAYALNAAAARDLERGDLDAVERRAGEALTAATVVRRRSEAAIARVCLGRAALGRGDRDAAAAALAAAAADRAAPLALSARASAALDGLEAALGVAAAAGPPDPGRATLRRRR